MKPKRFWGWAPRPCGLLSVATHDHGDLGPGARVWKLIDHSKRLQTQLSLFRVDKSAEELHEVRQERRVPNTYVDHKFEEVNELRFICVLL